MLYLLQTTFFFCQNRKAHTFISRRLKWKPKRQTVTLPSTVILTANKDMMSFMPWQTITKQFAKFVLIFLACLALCFHLIEKSSVKVHWTNKSSYPFNTASAHQSIDMFPSGSCHKLDSIILKNDTSFCWRFDTTNWPVVSSSQRLAKTVICF